MRLDLTYATLGVRCDDRGVATVTLNNPEKRNVLSAATIADLTDVARVLGASSDIRVMVLGGAGKVFCAGADLNWMQEQVKADRAERMREARKLAEMLNALNTIPIPLIGRVHGGAFGGGIGLACVCDVAIAENDTKFCFSETKLGLIPATISPYVVARMGEAKARRVFMSARVFGAKDAVDLGLVAKAVDQNALDDAIEAEVVPYLSTKPKAVAAAKALLSSLGPNIDPEIVEDTIRQLADVWETEEAAQGIAAFLARKPQR